MARGGTLNLVIAIALIVIGILMVLNKVGLGMFMPFLGIILIVLGILILIGKFPGSTLMGIACLVIGILLAAGFLNLPKAIADVMWIVNIVLGIVLIFLGVQRLR